MSSIIVLDSSDEDETPPKKPNLKSSDFGISSSLHSKNDRSKQKKFPTGITITPHNSQMHGIKTSAPSALQMLQTSTNANNAITNLVNNDRQTPTPPKTSLSFGNQSQRKRKTTTSPPSSGRLAPKSFANMSTSNIMSPAAAATTMAPLPPIMPMITGVHSMAVAGATPPLQLMATPPRILGSMAASINEQIMINPNMLQSNLPPNKINTAHTIPNPNQNNINNNFKIHLPPKPLTPSPIVSPAASHRNTVSPQLMSLGGSTEKTAKRVKPNTILKSTDDAWVQQRPKTIGQSEDLYQGSHKDMSWEGASPSPESSKSSSRHQTPMASPSMPKMHKSPEVSTPSSARTSAVFDLTSLTPTVINLDDTIFNNSPDDTNEKQINGDGDKIAKLSKEDQKTKCAPKPPLEPEFEELINVCKTADPSVDMKKLIKNKLLKYYYEVHGDFVKSKSFRKSIRKVVTAIRAEPDLVYYNLTTIVEELKVRRKAKIVDPTSIKTEIKEETMEADNKTTETEQVNNSSTTDKVPSPTPEPEAATTSSKIPIASTGNKKLDEQIKKLNKALYVLTKRIEVLEQSEVDWDDDDSSFLQVERFKKRACQIYEKICDLTGESKNAHRLVKKPIKFNETRIPQFNKTLQAFINRTKEFPDYYDVLRMLEHCNRNYSLGLVNFEIKNIAEDAFIKVGKLLQSRRKADLYETVTHYGGREKDPAFSDPVLAAKLNENQKNYKKISDILEKYARKQDMPDEEGFEDNKADNESVKVEESLKVDDIDEASTSIATKSNPDKESANKLLDGESDDDDDEEDDDEEADLEEHVEKLANGEESDNESDNEHSNRDEAKPRLSLDKSQTEQMQVNDSTTIETSDVPKMIEILDSTPVVTVNCRTSDTTTQVETLNNNNNNIIDTPETKTVKIDTIAKECATPPPLNGKLKPTGDDNACIADIVNAMPPLANAIADVRIVTVSSHKTGDILSANSSDCSSNLFVESTHKTLEEIVISDEES